MRTRFFLHIITWVFIASSFETPIGSIKRQGRDLRDMCRWKRVHTNVKLKAGIGAGTFDLLGETPSMISCIDLCCGMPTCDVAFRAAKRCYGIECISDSSCETVPAAADDQPVQIAHVRAGRSKVNTTDVNMAGQCRPSTIYREVTLKGGINAGTYKDVGGVSTMEECQKKCCEFPACDLAFMLAGSCYLVGCADHKSCEIQSAKKSSFHPSVSYVTRWNSEGVKHTVLLQEKNSVRHKCPELKPLTKVTLKGGLQAGDFTDVGKVNTLEQCYDICCQQDKCDLAFMLGQNCFSVQCKDKRLCATIPAQPSIFNPQIAYVISREKAEGDSQKTISKPSGNTTSEDGVAAHSCPSTKILERATLKGGVDAGNFHDNGKVSDMKQCRRICCEMTHCHLAFMLGKNCFSVKCNTVDACRAQSAKPSTFYPQISYVRKVGTNELLKDAEESKAMKVPTPSAMLQDAVNKKLTSVLGGLGDSHPVPAATLAKKTVIAAVPQEAIKTDQTAASIMAKGKLLVKNRTQLAVPKLPVPCRPFPIQYNVTLKGGRNAGLFTEISSAKTIRDCVNRCCEDEKQHCNLALMLGTSCYTVVCKDKELCSTIPAPPSGFNPMLVLVRPPKEEKKNLTVKAVVPVKTTPSSTAVKPTKSINQCRHDPPIRGKILKGGPKAGKFKIFKEVKTMDACVKQCCLQSKTCDLALMQGGKCYTVLCTKKSLCMTVDDTDHEESVEPTVITYMKHFLEKPNEVEAVEKEESTELESQLPSPSSEQDESACNNVEITHNMTLKGGVKAGSFKKLGKMVDMRKCISSCCDKPDCDVAYLLNGHCFAVQCTDNKLCQTTTEPARTGDTVQLAYINKYNIGEKQRDWLVVYIIAGSLGFAATVGGIIWAVFAFMKRQRLRSKRRLLDEDEDHVDDIMTRTAPTRYRTPPMSRY